MNVVRTPFKLTNDVKYTFLHHLRHLLRESSYLPDPSARSYYHAYILDSFRAYRPRTRTPTKNATVQHPNSGRCLIGDKHRQVHLLHRCRKMHSLLYRANAGQLQCLTKVLHEAYGRSGRRRHALLQPYLAMETPTDAEAVRRLANSLTSHSEQGVPQLSKAVKIIAQAQMVQPSALLSRLPIRRLLPNIPAGNSWGRSTPVVRVRNIKRRGYWGLVDKLLPPLPRDEWQRLRDLSTGTAVFERRPFRRERGTANEKLTTGASHRITPRFMRRLWTRVFVQCPIMDRNERSRWRLEWNADGTPQSQRIKTAGLADQELCAA